MTVKIKYSDLPRRPEAVLPRSRANVAEIIDIASAVLATVYPFKLSARLLGVTLSSLTNDQDANGAEQPPLDLDF
ncbi:hypothetical protein [Pararhizobium sp. DWP3-4]|uniref:DinB/UmuC family translesion DNA polymerase n=1 Tax=unclassified Pararhizobium TaxID=2643050 RepID=UPI003CF8440E